MKKQKLSKLSLNKKQISNFNMNKFKGGSESLLFRCLGPHTFTTENDTATNPGQTGSLCLTGNGTNCQ